VLDQPGADHQVDPVPVSDAAHFDRLLHGPWRSVQQDRPEAKDLANRRGQVRLAVPTVDRLDQAGQNFRLAAQPLQRPGELGRSGFVSGNQQGQQFVMDLDL